MGSSQSSAKLLARPKKIIGTQELEQIWMKFGDGSDRIPKDKMKDFLKHLVSKMDIKCTEENLDEWIEECRSTQMKYSDEITFLHFKRLYLSIVQGSKHQIPLSQSLALILPAVRKPAYGANFSESTIATDSCAILPTFIVAATNYLNQPKHITKQGLYRVPGDEIRIQQYIQRIDLREAIEFQDWEEDVATGLIVKYLRQNPEKIFGPLMPIFENLPNEEIDDKQKFDKLVHLLSQIPSANRETARVLCDHFSLVIQHQQQNLMNEHNLYTCVGGHLSSSFLEVLRAFSTNVVKSTVKYKTSFEESALRSNSSVPLPISYLLSFLDSLPVASLVVAHDAPFNEHRVREIIYGLNNDSPLILKGQDASDAIHALYRFFHKTTDSIWGSHESQLLEAVKAKREDEFLSLLQSLPPVHLNSIRSLALYIQKLYEGGRLTREEWCAKFIDYSIPHIMPYLLELFSTTPEKFPFFFNIFNNSNS